MGCTDGVLGLEFELRLELELDLELRLDLEHALQRWW
jgi:hypothetical protein